MRPRQKHIDRLIDKGFTDAQILSQLQSRFPGRYDTTTENQVRNVRLQHEREIRASQMETDWAELFEIHAAEALHNGRRADFVKGLRDARNAFIERWQS